VLLRRSVVEYVYSRTERHTGWRQTDQHHGRHFISLVTASTLTHQRLNTTSGLVTGRTLASMTEVFSAPWFFNRLWRYISSVLTYLLTYSSQCKHTSTQLITASVVVSIILWSWTHCSAPAVAKLTLKIPDNWSWWESAPTSNDFASETSHSPPPKKKLYKNSSMTSIYQQNS